MSYAANLAAMSRTRVTLVRITLDWCANTFGVLPCTSSGNPCYNTYHTCKVKGAFVKTAKTYDFTSNDAPVPWPGPRPYIKQITYLPSEITDNVTVTGRIKVDLSDEPDSDIGIDPYVEERPAYPAIPGTFFKKLLARNPNYKGRMLEVWEGFLGDPFEEFQKRANEPLELAAVKRDTVTLQTVDLLKGVGDIEVPPQLDVKLLGGIAIDAAEMVLDDTTDVPALPDAGYVKIGDEIIHYGTINRGQRKLTGCSRGAFNSAAATHSDKDAVQLCRYYPPGNPFDHLKSMLLDDAGLDPALVDTAAIDYWRDWPGGEADMTCFLTEPTKLADLLLGQNQTTNAATNAADLPPDRFGLVDLLDCKIWVAESLAITIARNIPNSPGRAYRAISDAATVISGSTSTDMGEKARVTRTVLYWDKSPAGRVDDPASYARRDIGVNGDAEREYADIRPENVYCRWLKSGIMPEEDLAAFISTFLARRLAKRRDAAPIITISVELKDSDILTGQYITFTTDEVLNADGTPIVGKFQVIRREPKGSAIDLKVQRMPAGRTAYYAPLGATDYTGASPADREYGGFYCDDLGLMPNGDPGFFY